MIRAKIALRTLTVLKQVAVPVQVAQRVGTPSFQNQLPVVTTTPGALEANFQQPSQLQYCPVQIVLPEHFLSTLAKCLLVVNVLLEDIRWQLDLPLLTIVLNVQPVFIRKPLEHRPMSASIAPVVSPPTRSWDPPNAAQWTFLCLYGLLSCVAVLFL